MICQRSSIWTVTAGIGLFVVSTGWADVPAPPVNQTLGMVDVLMRDRTEASCRSCHDSGLADRHHNLYGAAMASAGEDYPYGDFFGGRRTAASHPDFLDDGIVDSTYTCLSCHGDTFTVERDCTACHTQSPHHTTADAVARHCTACHGSIVDDPDDGHYIPSYEPSDVTPYPSSYLSLGNRGDDGQGSCDFCHSSDSLVPPVIQKNHTLHHETYLDLQQPTFSCAWCHDMSLPGNERIRTCETCHGPDSLHNIQADSPNPNNIGSIVVGGEDAGYGHNGRDAGPGDSDCWGCHGFEMGASAPVSSPVVPTIYNTGGAVVKAGTDTLVELVGAAFTNMAGKTLFESEAVLSATDGSSVTLTPSAIDQGSLTVTIPANTAPGIYRLQAVKTNNAGKPVASNPAVVTVVPEVIIRDVSIANGIVTIEGSRFAGYAEGSGTSVTGKIGTTTVEATIVSWSDTVIKADFGSSPQEVTVNSVFGTDTWKVGPTPRVFNNRVMDGFETGSFSALPWHHQETPWHTTLETFYAGLFSAQSGSISHNERSILTLTHNCKAGDIRFAVKVSSEQDQDGLIFSIDGQEIDAWSGEMDWIYVDYPVTAGPHTFTWSYEKNVGRSHGQDTAWIDWVSIPWPMHDGFETRDFSLYDWQHQNVPWQIASDSHTGGHCAQSGDIKNNENSTLWLNRYCAKGTIQFAIKVSSEEQYDKLIFRIDDQYVDDWNGLTDWMEVRYPVNTGWHTFSWSYEKNGSNSTNEDTAWIDDVIFIEFEVSEGPADMNFVDIPGGTFEMGDHLNVGWFDEEPVHPVTLDSYIISKYETTNAQYAEYLDAALADGRVQVVEGVVYAASGDQSEPYFDTHSTSKDSQIEYNQGQFTVLSRDGHSVADHPVVKVSWYGAMAFCGTYGYRLPTEAEWEYAAQGGYHDLYYKYPWDSNTIDENKANYDFQNPLGLTTLPYTTPVGRYGPQGTYGLCDMAGNVLEWCQDRYDSYDISASPVSNPVGPSKGDCRVLRGGSWFHEANFCRTADRNRYDPLHRSRYSGFRVCVSVAELKSRSEIGLFLTE